jgi:hypothetical protein
MKIRCALLAAPLALAGVQAQAQAGSSPYYLSAMQDFSHQSNVNSQPAGAEVSDTISTTTLRGGVNALFGRQRAYANAAVNHQRYGDLTTLDNTGYNVTAGLDWATVERLSGTLSLGSDRRQAALNSGIATASLRNTQRADEATAKVRLGGDSILGFDASLAHRRVTFSAPEFATRQYRQDSGSAGVTYRVGGSLTLGAGLSTQKTDYRVAVPPQIIPDASKGNDVYFTANWVPSGASTVAARLNIGKTEYEQATAANFDGATGSLSWNWRPTGRFALTTMLSRDTGQDLGFQRAPDGTSPNRATDFSQVTDALSLNATYELTGKIVLTGGLTTSHRKLVDAANAGTGSDTTNSATIGARWAATRVFSLGCNAGRESRSASGTGTNSYDNDRVGCFVQATID